MRSASAIVIVALFACPVVTAQDSTAAKDPRNFTWIEEGVLALGGGGLVEADVEWLHAQGFGAIADFRGEAQDPEDFIAAKGMTFFDMPIDSASNINATQLAAFVAWAHEQTAAGRPIYIHCTNGWHRAAAFAAAWEMNADKDGMDEVAREIMAERMGTVMRAPSALLNYQSTLFGQPGLAVVLVSPLSRPELGGQMPVEVQVYANGAPAANARVRVWGEESDLALEGVTDASGRFPFVYTAPASSFMDHLYARASLAGFVDGADNVEFIFQQKAASRGSLDVTAERTTEGIFVKASHSGRAVPIRVVANAPGWSAFESSDSGAVSFPGAPLGAIDVRVVSWGSEGGTASVPAGETALAPAPEPVPVAPIEPAAPILNEEIKAEPAEEAAPGAPPAVEPGIPVLPRLIDATPPPAAAAHLLAARYAIMALAASCALGILVYASRKRAGVGNR